MEEVLRDVDIGDLHKKNKEMTTIMISTKLIQLNEWVLLISGGNNINNKINVLL